MIFASFYQDVTRKCFPSLNIRVLANQITDYKTIALVITVMQLNPKLYAW